MTKRAASRQRRPANRAIRPPEYVPPQDRLSLLADVAEMYYLANKNQAQIARVVGVTRSMVSRMLTEARDKGLVGITIRRPLQTDRKLELALKDCFDLDSAHVVIVPNPDEARLLQALGRLAAQVIRRHLAPGTILGLSWGTAVSATVEAMTADQPVPVKVVQLVGAMGARMSEYDAHGLVARLADRLAGEAYFLNAPFICDSPETVQALQRSPGVGETIELGKQVQVLLAGIGSTSPKQSSFYLAGYVPLENLQHLRNLGAVGDVCGLHFDLQGQECNGLLADRLVTIRRQDLLRTPIRLGVAGGPGKVEPILGALRSGYINTLVTDNFTARRVLQLAANGGRDKALQGEANI